MIQVLPQGLGIHSVTMYQRSLLSTSSVEISNSENRASKTAGKANSGKGDNSGESNQNADAGKPVRGGVRIDLSDLW